MGEHVDHICNVIISIDLKLRGSDPHINQESFSFAKLYVLWSGCIPRGRGKSPAEVFPNRVIESEALAEKINLTVKTRDGMTDLHDGQWIIHPIFGILKCKNAIKFMDIHSRHHVKIIDDIINNTL